MTEIPEHLLKRSKDRKQALGLGGDDAADAGGAGGGDGGSNAPVAAAAAAPAPKPSPLDKVPAIVDPEPEPPAPEPHYITAAKERKRMPVFAMLLVATVPIWAMFYAGTMQAPPEGETIFGEAEVLYAEVGCAGCHGAGGAGGVGYKLSDGEVVATFPEPIDMIVHIARGSNAIDGEAYGDPDRDGGVRVSGARGGGMPAHPNLTVHDLELIVLHERVTLAGEDTSSEAYAAWIEELEAHSNDALVGDHLDDLLACADPAYTPGATASAEDFKVGDFVCPGPHGHGGEEEVAAG